MTRSAIDERDASLPAERRDEGLGSAARLAAIGAGAFALAAAVALWASEGARVFVETAFSAMLACL